MCIARLSLEHVQLESKKAIKANLVNERSKIMNLPDYESKAKRARLRATEIETFLGRVCVIQG